MHYASIDALPAAVRHHATTEAQQLYLQAFNAAWEEFGYLADGHDDSALMATADRVACARLDERFQRDSNGDWHARH